MHKKGNMFSSALSSIFFCILIKNFTFATIFVNELSCYMYQPLSPKKYLKHCTNMIPFFSHIKIKKVICQTVSAKHVCIVIHDVHTNYTTSSTVWHLAFIQRRMEIGQAHFSMEFKVTSCWSIRNGLLDFNYVLFMRV